MSIIGNFNVKGDDLVGTIRTLTLDAKVTMRPVEKTGDKAPDYRIFAGGVEIGAAWNNEAKNGKAYLSVKLDDPSFAAPVTCRLITQDEQGNKYALVWSR